MVAEWFTQLGSYELVLAGKWVSSRWAMLKHFILRVLQAAGVVCCRMLPQQGSRHVSSHISKCLAAAANAARSLVDVDSRMHFSLLAPSAVELRWHALGLRCGWWYVPALHSSLLLYDDTCRQHHSGVQALPKQSPVEIMCRKWLCTVLHL